MTITIPQSVQDYFFEKPGRLQIVDDLFDHTNYWLPPGIERGGLREHYNNLLITAVVRTDYAVLLVDAWDAVWGAGLSACDIKKVIAIDDMDKAGKPNPHIIWHDALYQYYWDPRNEDAQICTALRYEGPINGFRILLAHFNQDGEPTLSEDANLGGEWAANAPGAFDGWFTTKGRAFLMSQQGNIFDPREMQEVAETALRALLDKTR